VKIRRHYSLRHVLDIDWIKAAGVYVTMHIAGKELLYRTSLNELPGKLNPLHFVRVHRSAIVNIDSIIQLEPISHGKFEEVLKNGSRARVSRTYRVQLEKRLGHTRCKLALPLTLHWKTEVLKARHLSRCATPVRTAKPKDGRWVDSVKWCHIADTSYRAPTAW